MWHFHPTQTPKEHFPRQRTPYKKYTTDEVDLSVLISHFKISEKKVFFFCVKFISKQLFFKHIHSPGKNYQSKGSTNRFYSKDVWYYDHHLLENTKDSATGHPISSRSRLQYIQCNYGC